jgi:hypothetical protein
MRTAIVVLALLCGIGGIRAATVDVDPLVDRFLTGEDTPLDSYRASRRMTARNARFKKEAWAEVVTALTPATGFTYAVLASGGSSMVVDRVLLPALENEARLWRSGEPARNALTRENYEFAPAVGGVAGEEELRVPIRARRKHILLVNGTLFLSPADGDLLRVEGRLSKSPSFWVSRVDVTRRYARIGGVRVPVELESVAQLRLAGRSEMRIAYRYESINGLQVTHPW